MLTYKENPHLKANGISISIVVVFNPGNGGLWVKYETNIILCVNNYLVLFVFLLKN